MYRAFLKDLKDNDSEAGVMLTDSRDVLVQVGPAGGACAVLRVLCCARPRCPLACAHPPA